MEPKEFERKFKEFMAQEMPGMHYQAVVVYTKGTFNAEGNIQVTNQSIGVDTKAIPFAVVHSLFKSLEMTVNSMMTAIYGPTMKMDAAKKDYDSMHR
jgi:hypothetical protein